VTGTHKEQRQLLKRSEWYLRPGVRSHYLKRTRDTTWMLPDSSCLLFFLSCVLSLFSLKTLTDQLSEKTGLPLLSSTPRPSTQQGHSGSLLSLPVCPRFRFKDLLPPSTPTAPRPESATPLSALNSLPLGIVAITVTLWQIRASRRAQCAERIPRSSEQREENFLPYYTSWILACE